MANSKYEYVRNFEREEYLLPNTWIVVRIDGRGFHKLSAHYAFAKPNDVRALNLMNAAAKHTFSVIPDLCIAYGVSDEYSFVFHKSFNLFERRAAKIVSTVVSTFTAAYVHLWATHFGPAVPLDIHHLPTFDGRAVCYPSVVNLRDYLSWRQVDCHINNLYNTTFHTLVQQGGLNNTEAEERLKGTLAADKNEILFSKFNINYNNEPEMFKKGSIIYRKYALEDLPALSAVPKQPPPHGSSVGAGLDAEQDTDTSEHALSKTQAEKIRKAKQKAEIVVEHLDIIKDDFWLRRPWILSGKPGRSKTSAGTV